MLLELGGLLGAVLILTYAAPMLAAIAIGAYAHSMSPHFVWLVFREMIAGRLTMLGYRAYVVVFCAKAIITGGFGAIVANMFNVPFVVGAVFVSMIFAAYDLYNMSAYTDLIKSTFAHRRRGQGEHNVE